MCLLSLDNIIVLYMLALGVVMVVVLVVVLVLEDVLEALLMIVVVLVLSFRCVVLFAAIS